MPKQTYEQALLDAIAPWQPDYICLAGFMRLLSPFFINAVNGKVINIHPSLLPKYKGLNTHKNVLLAGEKITGCTVHYVVPEMDAGAVIVQKQVPVLHDDTEDSLAARVLAAEHMAYPEAISIIAAIEQHTRIWDIFKTVSFYAVFCLAVFLALMALFLV
jgi:phosphoribosylglycinamide formyltransferase 1